jgi:hypothetical protein
LLALSTSRSPSLGWVRPIGSSETHAGQCEALLRAALEACERYYQAFQFVLWAGKTPEEALAAIMLETQGHA